MKKPVRAYLCLASAMAIVGSSVVAGKLVIASFPVFLASGLRFAIASAVLLPLFIRQGNGLHSIRPKDWGILSLQALAGVFLFSIFLLEGLKYTTAAESGVITSTTPAMAGLLAFLLLNERLTRANLLALALAVAGILILNLAGTGAPRLRGPNPWLGNLLVFGAVVGESLFIALGKIVSARISPLGISTAVSLLGLAMFAPVAVVQALRFDFSALAWTDWLPVLYFGIVVTVVAFLLWYSGLAHVPAGSAAVFTGVLPVSAVLLSYLVLDETFLWSHLLGGLFVLAAIALIARQHHSQ